MVLSHFCDLLRTTNSHRNVNREVGARYSVNEKKGYFIIKQNVSLLISFYKNFTVFELKLIARIQKNGPESSTGEKLLFYMPNIGRISEFFS